MKEFFGRRRGGGKPPTTQGGKKPSTTQGGKKPHSKDGKKPKGEDPQGGGGGGMADLPGGGGGMQNLPGGGGGGGDGVVGGTGDGGVAGGSGLGAPININIKLAARDGLFHSGGGAGGEGGEDGASPAPAAKGWRSYLPGGREDSGGGDSRPESTKNTEEDSQKYKPTDSQCKSWCKGKKAGCIPACMHCKGTRSECRKKSQEFGLDKAKPKPTAKPTAKPKGKYTEFASLNDTWAGLDQTDIPLLIFATVAISISLLE